MATTDGRTSVRSDPGTGLVYDGFISYSHAADDLLAPRLQAGLQRFAKPWWKRRALRIFRDESSLSANPHLWSSITDALDQSDWLVLLLSPDAAESEWVNNEVEYWLEHRDRSRIIPVVTDGEFGWSDGQVTGDTMPAALYGVFSDEPRWVDLRFARTEEQLDLNNASFRAGVADVAAAIRGVPKDELESEEVRQHRRTTRTAWAAAVALLLLGVGATAAAVVAVGQSSEAQAQRDEAELQTALAEEQTLVAEEQQAEAEAQRSEAETQTALAQEERDRAELLALEAISARLITESEAARLTEPAVADLLAVEARRSIDIEVTRANLARNTLSASALDFTRVPRSAISADSGPDGTWDVVTYGGYDDGVVSDSPTDFTVVEELDLVAQRPGARRLELPGTTFAVVDVSDDGSRMVVVYRNIGANLLEAVVVDGATFDPIGDPIPGPLTMAAINPDGSLIAAARTAGGVPVGTVDLMTIGGEVVTTLPAGGDGPISEAGLAFSHDARRLVSMQQTSSEGVIKAWDIETGVMLFRRSFGDVLFSNGPAISADGRYIAVPGGGQDHLGIRQSIIQVTVLDGETGKVVAEIALDTFDPSGLSVGFGEVEPVLAIGDSSGTSIVSTETFEMIRRIDHATGAIYFLGLHDEDRILVVHGAANVVTRVDLTVERSSGIALSASGITALSPAGDTIAVVAENGALSFWSAASGEQVGTADLPALDTPRLGPTVDQVARVGGVPVFSADGTLLYVRDGEGRFSVVDVDSGAVVAEIELPIGVMYNALAASPSGSFVATGHSDGTMMLWDSASFGHTDEPVAVWQLFDAVGDCATTHDPTLDGIRRLSIAESASGLSVQVVDQCGFATTWEIEDDEPVNVATWANSFVLDFGPGESNLSSQQGTRLRLLTDDGTVITDFTGHREEVLDTSTSLDQGTMASVSRDMVGLWYTRSGEPLAFGITGAQAHVAGDGSYAVTSGAAGFDWFGAPVVVWDLDPDSWEEQACESAGRNLTFFEWNQFFPDEGYRVTCPQWPSGF
jgi:WD40 repeat protein